VRSSYSRPAALACLAGLVCLSGCSAKHPQESDPPPPIAGKILFRASSAQPAGLHLAYHHEIGLALPAASLRRHFTAARDRCTNDAALHCILLAASLDAGARAAAPDGDAPSALLRLRLPHDQLANFANALTDPLPGERSDVVAVVRQSTTADDLSRPIEDAARRLAQLSDYRARLNALAARPDTKVDDLVKIASELSQVQSEIESAQAQQRDLGLQVDTEALDIDFSTARQDVAFSPVSQAWSRAGETFWQSVAAAIDFTIAAVPWLPLVALGVLALGLVRRAVSGRRTAARTP
jgi:hypothetical protein